MPTHDAKPTTMRVDIRPRFNNDQLAKGYADINMLTGAVVHFELSFHHQLQNITVNAQIGQEGYQQLVPTTMRTTSDFKLFGNRVYEICDIYPTYNFKCPTATLHNKKRQYDLTQQCVLRIDTTHVNLSAAYFDTIRPVALYDDAELIIAKIMQQQAKTDLSDPISLQKTAPFTLQTNMPLSTNKHETYCCHRTNSISPTMVMPIWSCLQSSRHR